MIDIRIVVAGPGATRLEAAAERVAERAARRLAARRRSGSEDRDGTTEPERAGPRPVVFIR